MKPKKILTAMLFPHTAVAAVLMPVSAAALVYAMLNLSDTDPIRIGAYVLAFYTLTIWCARVPQLVKFAKSFKNENKYARRWFGDPRLRVNTSLVGSCAWNMAYAVFQLVLGVLNGSLWYYALAVYYLALAAMRLFLVRHSTRHLPGERMRDELVRYRACGVVFLAVNVALSVMIFYMIYGERAGGRNEIVVIANAAYAFFTLTKAIVNVIKYRKYNSPVFSASKAISLASACVSMLTLEDGMLAAFGEEMAELSRIIFMTASGAAVSIFIVAMAVYMLVQGSRKINTLKTEE